MKTVLNSQSREKQTINYILLPCSANAYFDLCLITVEWSSKGKLIAVARKDTLNILSSNFIERSSMLLSFKSWIGDPDTDCIIKGMLHFTVVFPYLSTSVHAFCL